MGNLNKRIKFQKTNILTCPYRAHPFSTSIIPGRRFALPRAEINWAFSPKEGYVTFNTSSNLNNMLVGLLR